jgi:hypothetical protein
MPLIYKITAEGHLPYFGSTTLSLGERYMSHLRSYYTATKVRCSSADLFDEAGAENCRIELVEELPKDYTQEQILWRERHYIETNECVNICKRPIITEEERKEYFKNHHAKYDKIRYDEKRDIIVKVKKAYYCNNRDEILQKNNLYQSLNKSKIYKKQRERYNNKREEIISKQKLYYQRNKDEIKAKARARYAEKKARLAIVSTETGA